MAALRPFLVLGIIITASGFASDILGDYLGPIEYKGYLIFDYPEGENPINNIVFTLDSTLADNLIIVNVPSIWSYSYASPVLTLSGGSVGPGGSVSVTVSLNKYFEDGEYAVSSVGTTTAGEVSQASGPLLVGELTLLNIIGIAFANRYVLTGATIGLGFLELLLSRRKGKVVDEPEPPPTRGHYTLHGSGPTINPSLLREKGPTRAAISESERANLDAKKAAMQARYLNQFIQNRKQGRAHGTLVDKGPPLTEEMLENLATEPDSKQGSILDTVEKPDLKIDQGVGITSDGDLIHIGDDTSITFDKTSPPKKEPIPDITKEGKSFSEISGLELEQQDVEYRVGNTPDHPRKLSGLSKHTNIELKRSDLEIGDKSQSEGKGILRRIVDFFSSLF